MNMLLIKKLMVFALVFSVLIVARELGSFLIAFFSNGAQKYQPGKGRLITLGIAISYIFTIIFTGFSVV